MQPKFWTDDEADQLRKLYNENLTAEQIGEILGKSKNSVIGKLHRLGLGGALVLDTLTGNLVPRACGLPPSRRLLHPTREQVKAARQKLADKRRTGKTDVEQRKRNPTPKLSTLRTGTWAPRPPSSTGGSLPAEQVEMPVPTGFIGVKHDDLEPHHCRYPVGEDSGYLFCGQPRKQNSPYCPECHSVCHWEEP